MPFDSPYTPLQIPDVDIWSFLFNRSDGGQSADKVLFTNEDGSKSYTVSSLKKTALCFSEALGKDLSWHKGQVLGLVSANSIHIPPVIWGTLYAGGIVSPANPGYGVQELLHQFKDSGTSAIVTQVPFLSAVLEAATAAGISHDRIMLLPDEQWSTTFPSPPGVLNWANIISNRLGHSVSKAKIDPKMDVAFLVYSSGTTGLPKGVRISHHNIVSNILMFDVAASINSTEGTEDVVLAFLPFFHIYGLTVLLHHPFHRRACVVVMAQFSLAGFCNTIESHRVTVAYIVPSVAAQIAQSNLPTYYDLSSIRYMVSGAAPLSDALIKTLYSHFGFKLTQGYGLSETSPATFMMSLDDFPTANGTVGRLLPNQQAMLVAIDDPTTEVKSPGNPAEICVRGPNLFKGYHNDPATSKASFTQDGFFRTGDIGVLDAAGYLRVTDRLKDLIKYKGFQVAPAELEALLMGHEGVSEVCVVGMQDQRLATEVPRAYVVRTPGWTPRTGLGSEGESQVTAEEIRTWFDGCVANHKKLRGGVHFVNELPKTASGKILRRILKKTMTAAKL